MPEYLRRCYPPTADYASAQYAARLRAARDRQSIYVLRSGDRLLCVTLRERLTFYTALPLVEKVTAPAETVMELAFQ